MSKYSFKKFIKTGVAVIALLVMFGASPVMADDFDEGYDYQTTDYNVKLNVNTKAEISITEDISVDIDTPMHGIYRYIPLSRRVDYEAGGIKFQKSYAAMKISDISVSNDQYETFRERGNQVIRIGDPDKTVKGKKDYSLSYRVALYEDDESDFDVFYYNLLPYDWGTAIQKSKITLVMPKKFSKEDVTVLAGEEGDQEKSDKVSWSVSGNTINITTNATLPKGTGITVGMKLPEGYFEDAATHTLFNIIMYILGILFIAANLFLWYRFGRDPKSVQTVEFYPPDEISPAEVGYIIDGYVDKPDVISLLFYFAQEGIIEIEEKGKNDYIIRKLSELPPTSKTYERVFYDGLFSEGDEIVFSSLQESFYETFETTKDMIEAEFGTKNKKLFRGTANIIRIAMVCLPTIAAGIMAWITWRTFGSVFLLIASVLVVLMIPASYILGIISQDKKHSMEKPKWLLITGIGILMAAAAMLITAWISISVLGNWIIALLFAGVIGVGCLTTRFMRSRTKLGSDLLGRVLGFKEFIRVAEKDRLEKLIEENPQYFYDILPYAYVMGLSKKWARKFESIAVERPSWYRGGYGEAMFNTWLFYGMFNNFSRYAGATMNVKPADTGGSGGFGSGSGGFSAGGGFGGGGGGGW